MCAKRRELAFIVCMIRIRTGVEVDEYLCPILRRSLYRLPAVHHVCDSLVRGHSLLGRVPYIGCRLQGFAKSLVPLPLQIIQIAIPRQRELNAVPREHLRSGFGFLSGGVRSEERRVGKAWRSGRVLHA